MRDRGRYAWARHQNWGSRSIVGAGSVARARFRSDVIVAGNPARVVCVLLLSPEPSSTAEDGL